MNFQNKIVISLIYAQATKGSEDTTFFSFLKIILARDKGDKWGSERNFKIYRTRLLYANMSIQVGLHSRNVFLW